MPVVPEEELLVSIIMPFFRQDEFLLEAVESITLQTFNRWELIVVDDGSDRRSAGDILQSIAAKTDRIRVLRHDKNLGVSAAKNSGVAASKGALLLPVDSDDILEPDYLEKTIKTLSCSNSDGVYTDFLMFGAENSIKCTDTYPLRILSGWFPPNPVLMKREVFDEVGGYDLNFDLGEDACFWISAHVLQKRFTHLHEPLYRYRRHAASGTITRGQDYPLIMTKLARKFPELYTDNMTEIIDLLAQHWVQDILVHKNLLAEFHKKEREYNQLHSEFHKLLERVEQASREKKRPEGPFTSIKNRLRGQAARMKSKTRQAPDQSQ